MNNFGKQMHELRKQRDREMRERIRYLESRISLGTKMSRMGI